MWVAAIPSKDRAVAAIKDIQARAEGEFTAIEFVDYCAAEGMHH
jgi:hypothetical protein